MQLTYKNCEVIIATEEETYTFSIFFGESELYRDLTASSYNECISKAKKLIDDFVGDLPPALSYKHFNNGNN